MKKNQFFLKSSSDLKYHTHHETNDKLWAFNLNPLTDKKSIRNHLRSCRHHWLFLASPGIIPIRSLEGAIGRVSHNVSNPPAELARIHLASDPSRFYTLSCESHHHRDIAPQFSKDSCFFVCQLPTKFKKYCLFICFDTKLLAMLSKTDMIQNDNHNVPHYAYNTTAHVQGHPFQVTQIRSKWRLHGAITTPERQMLVYWKLTDAELSGRF